jgi:hypothetical protein
LRTKIVLTVFLAAASVAVACADRTHSKYHIYENPLVDAVRERTRTAKLYSQFDTILILDGTLYDMAVRRGMVEEDASVRRIGADEKEATLKAEADDDAKEAQFMLGVYAAKDEWNDLAEKNSRWAVFLDTPAGPVRPSSITKVEREKLALRDSLPYTSTFRRFYVVKFPREKAVGAPYRLVMTGLLGEVAILWER